MGASSGSGGFAKIRSTLLRQQPVQLIRVIGELYRLSKENQRFLEARFADASKQLHAYRRLVADCLFPDPLRKGAKVRIVEAKRAISQYERATGDTAGTVDLMLTFVERGTSFAGDLGYGEDAFFISLEIVESARRAPNGLPVRLSRRRRADGRFSQSVEKWPAKGEAYFSVARSPVNDARCRERRIG
jgi:hypothetical protein